MLVLTTPRLDLREWEPGDAAFVHELVNGDAWRRWIGDRGVRSEADAARWIEDHLRAGHRRFGFGFWAVVRRSDGVLVGMCGLTLATAHEGHGYAREAAAGCLQFAAGPARLDRVLAITHPEHVRSQRLLSSLGFTPDEPPWHEHDGTRLARFRWLPSVAGARS
jgi:ribosomal-protein-alanine N-acetyltransferase